ncbi:MAG: hypothetical protein ACJ8AD_14835 [Gemmatimonadaceae bacterium]
MDKTVPAFAAKLLDFIGSIEAPAGYDTVYSNAQKRVASLKARPITKRTVAEWIADGKRGQASSAAGRYQFMRDTLKSLQKELGLRDQQVMDADLQDRLGYHLLRRRGYDLFMAGKLSVEGFGLNLAKEWASFPVLAAVQGAHLPLKRGQSYYAGDKLNRALVQPAAIEALLRSKDAPRVVAPPPPPPPDVPAPEPCQPASAGFFMRLLRALFLGKVS